MVSSSLLHMREMLGLLHHQEKPDNSSNLSWGTFASCTTILPLVQCQDKNIVNQTYAARCNPRVGSVAEPSTPAFAFLVPRLVQADHSDLTPPSRSVSLFDRLHISPSSSSVNQRDYPAHHPAHAAAGEASSSTPEASTTTSNTTSEANTNIKNNHIKQKSSTNLTCQLCSKRFTRSYNLRSHLRTHNNERPFVCSACGKAFARHHDRKRHERLHLGDKQIVCGDYLELGEECGGGRTFSRVDSRARHLECVQPLFQQEMRKQHRRRRRRGFVLQQPPLPVAGMWATTMMAKHLAIGYGPQHHFGTTVPSPMDLGGSGMTWSPPSDHPGTTLASWTSMPPLPATPLAQYSPLAHMSWSAAAGSPGVDPFAAIESLFNFAGIATSDAAAVTRTPGEGVGAAYTKWWNSYTEASSRMKGAGAERGSSGPGPVQMTLS